MPPRRSTTALILKLEMRTPASRPPVWAESQVTLPPLHGRFSGVMVDDTLPLHGPPSVLNVTSEMLRFAPLDSIEPVIVDWLQLPLPMEVVTVASPRSEARTLPE